MTLKKILTTFEIVELEAAQVPRVVNEVAYVVLNGN